MEHSPHLLPCDLRCPLLLSLLLGEVSSQQFGVHRLVCSTTPSKGLHQASAFFIHGSSSSMGLRQASAVVIHGSSSSINLLQPWGFVIHGSSSGISLRHPWLFIRHQPSSSNGHLPPLAVTESIGSISCETSPLSTFLAYGRFG